MFIRPVMISCPLGNEVKRRWIVMVTLCILCDNGIGLNFASNFRQIRAVQLVTTVTHGYSIPLCVNIRYAYK